LAVVFAWSSVLCFRTACRGRPRRLGGRRLPWAQGGVVTRSVLGGVSLRWSAGCWERTKAFRAGEERALPGPDGADLQDPGAGVGTRPSLHGLVASRLRRMASSSNRGSAHVRPHVRDRWSDRVTPAASRGTTGAAMDRPCVRGGHGHVLRANEPVEGPSPRLRLKPSAPPPPSSACVRPWPSGRRRTPSPGKHSLARTTATARAEQSEQTAEGRCHSPIGSGRSGG
jgi:hypothetical protein